MDGMLSQEEINALLSGMGSDLGDEEDTAEAVGTETAEDDGINESNFLTDMQKDIIGEICNISMGTAATTLSSLVNMKVDITTPVVTYAVWDDLVKNHARPCVFLQIQYREGLNGNNILILKDDDVKIIADLMMGGDGSNTDRELDELCLSAICEAMNQMMGSASTSLSSMMNMKIDISPPTASLVDLNETLDEKEISEFLGKGFVRNLFRMTIGDLVDSEMMQLFPVEFARDLCRRFMGEGDTAEDMTVSTDNTAAEAGINLQDYTETQQSQVDHMHDNAMQGNAFQNQQTNMQGMPMQQGGMQQNTMQGMNDSMPMQQGYPQQGYPQQGYQGMPMQQGYPPMGYPPMGYPQMGYPQMGYPQQGVQPVMQEVNVQPAQFQEFSGDLSAVTQKENINLIMDVPLEVSVELGRTSKSIQDILEFSPGTIIELDKIAGEPIDVLVNGKYVAKGEVVVIEESFGVRVTEIIK